MSIPRWPNASRLGYGGLQLKARLALWEIRFRLLQGPADLKRLKPRRRLKDS